MRRKSEVKTSDCQSLSGSVNSQHLRVKDSRSESSALDLQHYHLKVHYNLSKSQSQTQSAHLPAQQLRVKESQPQTQRFKLRGFHSKHFQSTTQTRKLETQAKELRELKKATSDSKAQRLEVKERRPSSRWVSEGHAQIRLRLKQSDPRRRVNYHAPLAIRCQTHQSTQLTSRVVTWLKSPSQKGHRESLRISDHLSPLLRPTQMEWCPFKCRNPVQILAGVIFISCGLASAISSSNFDKNTRKILFFE